MFNNEYDYLIHLIECAINDTQPHEKPAKVKFDAVFEAAKYHEIANIAFFAVDKLNIKPDVELYKEWKAQVGHSIQRNINQLAACDEITRALSAQNIRWTQLQGVTLKKLYPYDFWRNMSDIDFIVDKENLVIIEDIMQKIGYKTKLNGDYELSAFGPKKIVVEFHSDFCNQGTEFFGRLTDPFKSAIPDENALYYMPSDTDVFLHNVLHTIKHHRIYGAGIRRILDVYFLNQKLLPCINKDSLNSFLSETGCKEDYDILSQIAIEWFDINGLKTNNYSDVKKNIFFSGNHGSLLVTIVNQHKKVDNKKQYKIQKTISLIFPTKEQIYKSHPFCAQHNLPVVLCWGYRFLYLLKNRQKRKYAIEILKNMIKL